MYREINDCKDQENFGLLYKFTVDFNFNFHSVMEWNCHRRARVGHT
jgi:hypothetical protein